MGNTVADDFNRPNGPLGSTPNGFAWRMLRGAASIASGRAVATIPPLGTPGSLAEIDVGLDGQDGTVTLDMGTVGSDAIYWRIAGAGSWLRLALHRYRETIITGTEQYITGYTQVQVGTRTVYVGEEQYITGYTQVYAGQETYLAGYGPTEYEYRAYYSSHPDGDNFGLHSQTAWGTSQPYFPGSLSHNHYHFPYGPDSDIITHYHSLSYVTQTGNSRAGAPIYQTRAVYKSQPIYGTRSVYRTEPIYEQRPVYGTRNVTAVVERAAVVAARSVGGAVTVLRTERVDDALTTPGVLSVAFNGDQHAVLHPVTRAALFTLTDALNVTSTLHGFGTMEPVNADTVSAPNTDGVDGWIFSPARGGIYVPTLMR